MVIAQLAKIHNIQVTPKIYNNTILLWYVSMWGCIYIIFHRGFYPRVGMCSTHTPTSKLYQIFTQFTKSHQNYFDTHFDETPEIQAKINFLTIQNHPSQLSHHTKPTKIKPLPNSSQNHHYNKEITPTYNPKPNLPIIINSTKINTFLTLLSHQNKHLTETSSKS